MRRAVDIRSAFPALLGRYVDLDTQTLTRLVRRETYGGRKGRAAARRLRAHGYRARGGSLWATMMRPFIVGRTRCALKVQDGVITGVELTSCGDGWRP